jgi:hypothetical protein
MSYCEFSKENYNNEKERELMEEWDYDPGESELFLESEEFMIDDIREINMINEAEIFNIYLNQKYQYMNNPIQ